MLYEEVRTMGYRGSYTTVRTNLRLLRQAGVAPVTRPLPKFPQITFWMLRRPDGLKDRTQSGLG